MKVRTTLLGLVGVLASVPSFAQNCSCNDLSRRSQGLNNVIAYARPAPGERRQLRRLVDVGYQYLRYANSTGDYQQQNYYCSLGNQQLDASWQRWQPWLASQGLDPGNPCGF